MYSENQAIQKKRNNVQASTLEWIINHLKALQNNIARINNLLITSAVKEISFTLQFNDYFTEIIPNSLRGDPVTGGYSTYETYNISNDPLIELIPYGIIYSKNSITIQAPSDIDNINKLVFQPISLTYTTPEEQGVTIIDMQRTLLPCFIIDKYTSDSNARTVCFSVDHNRYNTTNAVTEHSGMFIYLIIKPVNGSSSTYTIEAQEFGGCKLLAHPLVGNSISNGLGFKGRTISFTYRFRASDI